MLKKSQNVLVLERPFPVLTVGLESASTVAHSAVKRGGKTKQEPILSI